jgi:hypothetical protein
MGLFVVLLSLAWWDETSEDWHFKAAFLLPVALSLLTFWRAREHFWYGDINPAIVISLRPSLIAVYGDLSTGGAPFRVIKVLPHRLNQMSGGPFKLVIV